MTRSQAIALALSMLRDDDIVVAADGAIARETYRACDRLRNFYMLGSMGQVASIGLGLAMTRKERVIALDGDGNLLMGFGGLALVGGIKPTNFYQLILDNQCYATTGGQPALSRQVDLAAAAAGCGYAWTGRCESTGSLNSMMEVWLAAKGPALLDLLIEPLDPNPTAPRIPLTPEEMALRVRGALTA